MKVFFDRFSDLIRIEKDLSTKLRGMNMAVISNSHDTELDYDFYIPFKKSAENLEINYKGNKHFNLMLIYLKKKQILKISFIKQ